jgi:GTPase
MTKFMLFGMVKREDAKDRTIAKFAEAKSLVETFGGRVESFIYQLSQHQDQSTFIGRGKTEEILEDMVDKEIDVLVINEVIKPTQIYALKELYKEKLPLLEIWDRVDLILHIFQKHAKTAEAKLQIKLAEIRHMGPILYGMGMMLSRQGGGIGTRGLGETNTEIEQRHFREALRKINERLDKITASRQRELEQRRQAGLATASIVGYTNAGKTTLFNLLTRKENLAQNILFATLDSSVGKIYLPQTKKSLLITDTIGFIDNLPPALFEAFKSTLLETVRADMILHVIDVSAPWMKEKILTVEQILKDLGVEAGKEIYVFNKLDLSPHLDIAEMSNKYSQFKPLFLSAATGTNLNQLTQMLEANFDR